MATVMIVAATSSTLVADQTDGTLVPVPPMRTVPQPLDGPKRAAGQTPAARQLSWRPSQKVVPPQTAELAATPSRSAAGTASAGLSIPALQQASYHGEPLPSAAAGQTSVGILIAQSVSPRIARTSAKGASRASSISQATFTQDTTELGAGGFSVPGGDGQLPPRIAAQPQLDPFSDPFSDMQSGAAANADRLIIRPQDQEGGFAVPPSLESGGLQLPNMQDAVPTDPSQAGNALAPPSSIPSPFNRGDVASPSLSVPESNTLGPLNSPSDQALDVIPQADDVEENLQPPGAGRFDPFQRRSPMTEPQAARNIGQYETESCDELRARIAARRIQNISLDISPPFRPDILEEDTRDEKYNDFREAQLPRNWRSMNGDLLAEGEFVGLEFEKAIIKPRVGPEIQVPLARLSEPDLEYITEQWGLPRECQLPNIAFQPRQWLPTTMTWKASGLCHKPLYFEEVSLERYGHTVGPFAQPVLSTAHFFVNIAVLPYKMGIHPPNECQYALGYYRPGNCAPWIIPPVPISLRGALFEAGAIGAGIALIP